MADPNDSFLLQEFAERQSESAFSDLVQRHVNFVYSVAMRYVGNPADAQEVAQAVFLILARKSASLCGRPTLMGWLYETTRLTARQLLRTRMRRLAREQEAYMQSTLDSSSGDPLWHQLAPHLEEAMSRLRAADRELLALRFYENKTGEEAALLLGIGAAAAHKRTNRALEKLRVFFSKRGVDSTTAVIASAISGNSIQPAPAGLAKTISAVALAKGAAASTSTLTLLKGALKIMAWSSTKTAIVAASALVLVAGTSIVVVRQATLIQGKTESEWIKSIVYPGDDHQRIVWHSLGPRGIRMLLRAMKPTPTALTYEQALASHGTIDLTAENKGIADVVTQRKAAMLLSQLAGWYDVKSTIPDVIKLLKTEKQDEVRALELGFFEVPMRTMSEQDKAALLPELTRSLQSDASDERNNALVALQYYPNQKENVAPLIVNAMQDPSPMVRVRAIDVLNAIDPQNPAASNSVSVLAGCVTGPYGDTPDAPNEAVVALGELHRDPDVAVPALIQALQSDDRWVRANAADALSRFGGQARAAIPALQKALKDTDPYARDEIVVALRRINSGAPAR